MLLDDFSATPDSSDHQLQAEKMDEIVDFILQGKYSSACLLLLESTGQDPLHYIPYRTYNRLQKQRQQARLQAAAAKTVVRGTPEDSRRSQLTDLDYIEPLPEQLRVVQGGFGTGRSDIRSNSSLVSPSRPLPVWQHQRDVS